MDTLDWTTSSLNRMRPISCDRGLPFVSLPCPAPLAPWPWSSYPVPRGLGDTADLGGWLAGILIVGIDPHHRAVGQLALLLELGDGGCDSAPETGLDEDDRGLRVPEDVLELVGLKMGVDVGDHGMLGRAGVVEADDLPAVPHHHGNPLPVGLPARAQPLQDMGQPAEVGRQSAPASACCQGPQIPSSHLLACL